MLIKHIEYNHLAHHTFLIKNGGPMLAKIENAEYIEGNIKEYLDDLREEIRHYRLKAHIKELSYTPNGYRYSITWKG